MANPTNPKIEAIGNFVLVEMPPKETKTAGGILIPESAADLQHRAINSGIIRSVGHKCTAVSTQMLERAAFFGRYAGVIIEAEKEGEPEYRLIDEDEIRGIA